MSFIQVFPTSHLSALMLLLKSGLFICLFRNVTWVFISYLAYCSLLILTRMQMKWTFNKICFCCGPVSGIWIMSSLTPLRHFIDFSYTSSYTSSLSSFLISSEVSPLLLVLLASCYAFFSFLLQPCSYSIYHPSKLLNTFPEFHSKETTLTSFNSLLKTHF